MRSCQEHRAHRELGVSHSTPLNPSSASQDMLQCGLCGRGISGERFIGGRCEGEGCGASLCLTCWCDDYRTCRKHLLTNEHKLEQAKAALAQGQLSVLVEAETARFIEDNFISRFELKVQTLQGMRNPFGGKPLRLGVHSLNWERRDEKEKIPRFFKRKPVHPELFARVPLNQVLRIRLPLRRGIARTEQTQLVIVAQCCAHLEAHVRHGFDTEPVKRSELLSLLERYVEDGRQ